MWINIPRIPSILYYIISVVLLPCCCFIFLFTTNILVFISATSICMYVGLFIYFAVYFSISTLFWIFNEAGWLHIAVLAFLWANHLSYVKSLWSYRKNCNSDWLLASHEHVQSHSLSLATVLLVHQLWRQREERERCEVSRTHQNVAFYIECSLFTCCNNATSNTYMLTYLLHL